MLANLDLGLIYAIMALGVFLTYRILNFPDLTVDGSFTTGAGTAALLITSGVPPLLATAAAIGAGGLAGLITALLHTKARIDPLLASILTMIALYSINLRIMGRANLPLLNSSTVFTPFESMTSFTVNGDIRGTVASVVLLAIAAIVIKLVIDWFLQTDFGLAVQATGDNPAMAASFGVSTDFAKIVTLVIANGLVGCSGAIIAQYQRYADVSMGIGMILVGLASVIVGNAILGTRFMFLATLGVIVGSVVYRLVIFWALKLNFLQTNDMKLISAVLVVVALVISQSKTIRSSFAKLWPWRRDQAPEPLLEVPSRVGDAS